MIREQHHTTNALARLISQFRDKLVIEGLVKAFAAEVQEIEDVLWQIFDAFLLNNAVGQQLQTLGKLVGEPPLGRPVDEYRMAIRLRIRANRSKGRTIDLIDVARLTLRPVFYRDHKEHEFEIQIFGLFGERSVARILSSARAATTYGILVASDLPAENLLMFDDAVEPVPGIETFSDAISGGKVAASGYALPADYSSALLMPFALLTEDGEPLLV